MFRPRLVHEIFRILKALESDSIPERVWLADSGNSESEFHSLMCLVDSKEVNEEVVEMHVADKKIADSWFTATYLCSKEVEMVVLENIFVRKDETQGSAFADLSIVGANNQIFATDVVNAGTIAVLKDGAEGNENVESTTSEMSI
ncbi:hypothetical protein Tco_0843178 [Tanacetum coccineum]|uniref:Uncharacterized protein n=1 Tax=Tanacetum coccineum TaxID=301880 RepID=A0ABQ5B5G9_9ASTR